MTDSAHGKKRLRRDVLIAAACGVLVAGMVGASFAAIPLYKIFCQVTGFAGTTQVSRIVPKHELARELIIRLDSNVAPGLPWKFEPEQNEIKLHIGEVATVHYKVVNEAARTISAQASYNVSPPTVGAYFDKINCFCFTEQTMKPGETREMTVVFYVDPAIVKDHDQDPLNTITLSYTFYRLPKKEQPVADATAKPTGKL
jgi:cytochrome c oxidase assembly protein subunit 11